jgi:hypothetical protein
MDGAAVYLEPGGWDLNFDISAKVHDGHEEYIRNRPRIHITASQAEYAGLNPSSALRLLNKERRHAGSDEYEVPEEFHELMRQPNETPYRNDVVAYYYTWIINSVGRRIAKRQNSLDAYMMDVYIERLFAHFGREPDEVLTMYIWSATIALLMFQPDFICERALAMPELENTRLGRYVREYACRDKAAGGGK